MVNDYLIHNSVMPSLPEPILASSEGHNAYAFRIKYPRMFDAYKSARSCFWRETEGDYVTDVVHWDTKLTDGEKRFLSYVLAFFATADGIVNKNIDINFEQEVQPVEAKMFYHFQQVMEDIHMITYSDMLRAFVRNEQEIDKLIDAVHTLPCIAAKAKWAEEYMDAKAHSFLMRILAFACMEGIFFSSAFASIFHFKHRGLMPGLSFTNSLISRDENLHCEFACQLFLTGVNRPTQEEVHQMVKRAVSLEEDFVRDAIPVRLIGINADSMCNYVQYCADRLLKEVGYDPIWNASNPFPWIEYMSIPQKTNRFECRAAEYEMRDDPMVHVPEHELQHIDF
jgi:ribonucleotide reductase beta subunit family protein with ferritin-like domain